MSNKSRRGFTLIELLVVIAIIGLLATIALVAVNQSRIRSRDTRRMADIKQIQTALEMYYQQYDQYPEEDAEPQPGAGGFDIGYYSDTDTTFIPLLQGEGLIENIPGDLTQEGVSAYKYRRFEEEEFSIGPITYCDDSGSYYILAATFEDTGTNNCQMWTCRNGGDTSNIGCNLPRPLFDFVFGGYE